MTSETHIFRHETKSFTLRKVLKWLHITNINVIKGTCSLLQNDYEGETRDLVLLSVLHLRIG